MNSNGRSWIITRVKTEASVLLCARKPTTELTKKCSFIKRMLTNLYYSYWYSFLSQYFLLHFQRSVVLSLVLLSRPSLSPDLFELFTLIFSLLLLELIDFLVVVFNSHIYLWFLKWSVWRRIVFSTSLLLMLILVMCDLLVWFNSRLSLTCSVSRGRIVFRVLDVLFLQFLALFFVSFLLLLLLYELGLLIMKVRLLAYSKLTWSLVSLIG